MATRTQRRVSVPSHAAPLTDRVRGTVYLGTGPDWAVPPREYRMDSDWTLWYLRVLVFQDMDLIRATCIFLTWTANTVIWTLHSRRTVVLTLLRS